MIPDRILITPRNQHPSPLEIELPRSKSMLNRYLLMYALQHRTLPTDELSAEADDVRLMKAVVHQILQSVHCQGNSVVLDCGNAGTVARMSIVLAAFLGVNATFTGVPRLLERPVMETVDVLKQAGVMVRHHAKEEFLPLQIIGNGFNKNYWHIRASQSSQHLSALLLTGPFVPNGITVHLPEKAVSKPYIDLTITMMRDAGATVDLSDRIIRVEQGGYPLLRAPAEADWSAAAFALQATALMPKGTQVLLKNLSRSGSQGDEAAEQLFALLGVNLTEYADGLMAMNIGMPSGNVFADLTETPDLFNAFAVTAALLHADATIRFPEHLVFKESDRLKELIDALESNGFVLELKPDDQILHLQTRLIPYPQMLSFNSAGDHRIAMSSALAGIKYKTMLENPHVVAKSFPSFFKQLNQFAESKQV